MYINLGELISIKGNIKLPTFLTTMADLPNPQKYVDDELARNAIIVSLVCAVAGAFSTYWFSGAPSYELTVAIGLLGGGVAGMAFFDMYRNQPNMQTNHLLPYMVLLGLGVLIVSNGVGGGYVALQIGAGLFALMGLTVFILARLFEYQEK
jgi:hypothetical protein